MKVFARSLLLCSIVSVSVFPAHSQDKICPSLDEVTAPFSAADADAFAKPQKVHYPEVWFHFIDGNVDRGGITKDLEAIAGSGISGIQLFHGGKFGGDWPGVKEHVMCLSPDWDGLVAHTAAEARRLGLRFTMQNCPGWSMSGGPWISHENAMRVLRYSRSDIDGGSEAEVQLPVPVKPGEEEKRDWHDIMVLAFPTPDGDDNGPAVPSRVFSDSGTQVSSALFAGESAELKLQPSGHRHPHYFELIYDEPQTLRSLVFSPVQKFNHDWCYEPGISVTVEAHLEDGSVVTVLDSQMPMSSWQDNKTMTFALDEATASKFVIYVSNEHPMRIMSLQVLGAARKNNWEAEAANTLRAPLYGSEHPAQSASAFVKRSDVLDISENMSSDGTLRWKAPAGKWTIIRVGHVNSGFTNAPAPAEATGWECDKLAVKGADTHFAGYIGRVLDGPAKGLLNSMLMDSWECNEQTWTAGMEQEFSSFNGYSLRSWMPALFGYVVDDHETTAQFLNDWRSCVGHLFAYNYYGRMAENAKKHGLDIVYETAAGDIFNADILEYYKFADVPMCEFWNNPTPTFVGSFNFKPIKMTASAAHVYGKTRVAAESLTSFALTWDEHMSRLKDVANQNYARGVSHSVFQTYTHNPCADTMVPGTSFGAAIGTPFLRSQTWWPHMGEFNNYFARLSYMLERGLPVADVLWYLGDGSMHKPDEDAPFPAGYKYDYCNQDVLLHRLSVVDGRLVTPEGISYSVLWLPDNHHMLPATAACLRRLVDEGAVIVGEAPMEIATLVTSADVPAANGTERKAYYDDVTYLWGIGDSGVGSVRRVGRGAVYSGMPLDEALERIGIEPDLVDAASGEAAAAGWIHRRTEGADWYFVAAPLNESFSGTLDINCSGAVSLWDPVTGTSRPVAHVSEGGRTLVDIDLPYAGSCFIMFDNFHADEHPASVKCVASVALDDDWSLEFPEGWGAPESVALPHLASWTELDMSDEARAFSGTATYRKNLNIKKLDKKAAYLLELGAVEEIAKVKVNGQELVTLWCEPYSADITSALHKGDNEIEIEVTNTWFNRLVFDASRPESERKTWVIHGPAATEQLRPAGLLGPVSVTVNK